jgi:hypothetical protein
VRIGRAFILTSSLALAAACVSTSGLDDHPVEPPPDAGVDAQIDAGSAEDAAVDQSSPVEDADASIDVFSVDGGGKLADLRELFAAPLDPSLWYTYITSPFTSSQASEQLHLVCQSKVTNKAAYIKTLRWFDGNASSVHVNLVTAGNAGIASETNIDFVWMKITDAKVGGGAVEIGVASGDLYAKRFANTVGTVITSTKYLPVTMAWLRLREASGSMFWEYAQTVTGPWQVLHTETAPMAVDTVTVEVGVGGYPGTPGEVIIDNINGP